MCVGYQYGVGCKIYISCNLFTESMRNPSSIISLFWCMVMSLLWLNVVYKSYGNEVSPSFTIYVGRRFCY
jgi:hypothetical protein